MLVGMGTVFVFLTVLVLAMSAMSSIALRFSASPPHESGVGDEEVAAIAAAIAVHRKRK
tara:strand:+ start:157 stop:333 length:177 start_codon:yes stop_codon:yes gene_type:complete